MSDRACDQCGEQGHDLELCDIGDGNRWLCAACIDILADYLDEDREWQSQWDYLADQ